MSVAVSQSSGEKRRKKSHKKKYIPKKKCDHKFISQSESQGEWIFDKILKEEIIKSLWICKRVIIAFY